MKQVVKSGTTVNFTYRPDGLRARKQVVGGLTIDYVYDGQTVVGETRSNGTSSWYTPGVNGYISRTDLDSAGNVTNKEWFVYDGLGSCRALVKPNAQGTDAVITARMDYDVYGKVRTQTGSTDSKFKYVAGIGHPTDEETGLIYMRARYYEPGVGRFVSEDPGQDGGNWYAYAQNNPVNKFDPSGQVSAWAIFMGLGWLFTFIALKFTPSADFRVGELSDAVANFVNRRSSMGAASALIASMFFGLAALDLGLSGSLAYASAILSNISGGLLAAVVALAKYGQAPGAKMAQGLAAIAVTAAVGYGFMLIGYIASIGVELEHG